jgi:hypothetical protein
LQSALALERTAVQRRRGGRRNWVFHVRVLR